MEQDLRPHRVSTGWLQIYIEDAVQRKLCTSVGCTTCGAREFWLGLLKELAARCGRPVPPELDRGAAADIGHALADVRPSREQASFESAVRMILYEVWRMLGEADAETTVGPLLSGSWSGAVLANMQEHHRHQLEARRAHEESQRPEVVQRRREEKQRARQAEHARRLERKKERDRAWRSAHGEGSAE